MVEGKHHLTTIIHMVQTMWRIRYGCGLVEWEHFYDERSGSSGGVEEGKREMQKSSPASSRMSLRIPYYIGSHM